MTRSRMLRSLVRLRRHPSAVLLLVQLGGVLMYPFLEHTATGRALFGVLGLGVLAAALWVVRRGPWLTWLGSLIALPVVALLVLQALRPDPHLLVLTSALEAAFYYYAAGSLISYMLQDEFASTDELFAAGATFTLLAWAFAHTYVVCEALVPGSFAAAVNPDSARSWMELLFLSFTVLSGVGLGDIIPLSPMARSLVMLEEFTGVMYIALVVSRLIGLTVARRQ